MDFSVIKAMFSRRVWSKLRNSLPIGTFGTDTVAAFAWIDSYYEQYHNADVLDLTRFKTLLSLRGRNLSKDQADIVLMMIQRAQSVSDIEMGDTLALLAERACDGEIGLLREKYNNGDEIEFLVEAKQIIAKYSSIANQQEEFLTWENGSVDEVLADTDETVGLKLNFCGLADTIQGIKGGDNIAVCSGVDFGKSSFLASIVCDFNTQMIQQPDRYGDRPIIWLVNEGKAVKCVHRMYSAATCLNMRELKEFHAVQRLEPLLKQKLGDDFNKRIRIKNAHSMSVHQVISLVEEWKPAVLITDMTANLKGSRSSDASETQNLEFIWQTLRSACAEHDCVHIGTIQLSHEGYNDLYPALTSLKQSKIGIQGALDLCIMIGRKDPNSCDPSLVNVRGISTPKNKLPMSGSPNLNQNIITFDAQRCQWKPQANFQASSAIVTVNAGEIVRIQNSNSNSNLN